jgi:hypothetical protein
MPPSEILFSNSDKPKYDPLVSYVTPGKKESFNTKYSETYVHCESNNSKTFVLIEGVPQVVNIETTGGATINQLANGRAVELRAEQSVRISSPYYPEITTITHKDIKPTKSIGRIIGGGLEPA